MSPANLVLQPSVYSAFSIALTPVFLCPTEILKVLLQTLASPLAVAGCSLLGRQQQQQ